MKNLNLSLFTLALLCLPCASLFAQTNNDSQALVKQGTELHDQGKYAEAIEKYTEALKADPENLTADYEMGFTLYTSGKGKDAIPFLEKIIASPKGNKYETCDLLGSIYDDSNDPDNAIKYYLMGIKDNPNFEKTHFNLGITYLRQKKYIQAEASEIEAIKLDPKHASNQRIYAMAEYDQGKRLRALLVWCSFLLLEPQTQRAAWAWGDIKNILNYGIKDGGKNVTITVSDNDLKSEDFLLPMTILAATTDKKNLSPVDSLTLQLTEIFKVAGEVKEIKNDTFFSKFYVDFFSKLAESNNMPAFAHFISLTVHKDEDLAWIKDNQDKLNALDMWIRENPRNFK